MIVAATTAEASLAFIELGLLAIALAAMARFAGRLGITAVPLYLLGGLAVGDGGVVTLDVSGEFLELTAEIGVLLLLLALGLEYDQDELRSGLRTGVPVGAVDFAANAIPGFAVGLLLGWDPLAAVLLGGVTWVSSSGIVSKVLFDLDRMGFRETPSILNVLVIEDLAMAVYLPIVAAFVAGGAAGDTAVAVGVAVGAVVLILALAFRLGEPLSARLGNWSNESLLLFVFGLTLLVAGLAQRIEVSGAIGAFLVGLSLSGRAGERAMTLITPLRDLFAATFFVVFSFRIDPADVIRALVPAIGLALLGVAGKGVTGWFAARRAGVGERGRRRAGAALVPRGEFSIVIAALGSTLVDGPDLEAVAAAYVLIVAVAGPLLARAAR
ncbi:MAG: cation:proton antiporter [Desertimonas sp.]